MRTAAARGRASSDIWQARIRAPRIGRPAPLVPQPTERGGRASGGARPRLLRAPTGRVGPCAAGAGARTCISRISARQRAYSREPRRSSGPSTATIALASLRAPVSACSCQSLSHTDAWYSSPRMSSSAPASATASWPAAERAPAAWRPCPGKQHGGRSFSAVHHASRGAVHAIHICQESGMRSARRAFRLPGAGRARTRCPPRAARRARGPAPAARAA